MELKYVMVNGKDMEFIGLGTTHATLFLSVATNPVISVQVRAVQLGQGPCGRQFPERTEEISQILISYHPNGAISKSFFQVHQSLSLA